MVGTVTVVVDWTVWPSIESVIDTLVWMFPLSLVEVIVVLVMDCPIASVMVWVTVDTVFPVSVSTSVSVTVVDPVRLPSLSYTSSVVWVPFSIGAVSTLVDEPSGAVVMVVVEPSGLTVS